jgi:hypothetical protein
VLIIGAVQLSDAMGVPLISAAVGTDKRGGRGVVFLAVQPVLTLSLEMFGDA